MGAGIAVSGELIRRVPLMPSPDHWTRGDLLFASAELERQFGTMLLVDRAGDLSLGAMCDASHAVIGYFTFDQRLSILEISQVQDRIFGNVDSVEGERLLQSAKYRSGAPA